jgi:hypothetical protein
MLKAIARQVLRKMEVLCAAYKAYHEHFYGSLAALLWHLQESAGVSDTVAAATTANQLLTGLTRFELL